MLPNVKPTSLSTKSGSPERHRAGDDVLAIARKLLREKCTGGNFYAPLRYPPSSVH